MADAVAPNCEPDLLEVPRPTSCSGPAVYKVSNREIREGKGEIMECRAPIVFMGVILQTTPGERKSYEICRSITRRLGLWEIRKHASLCLDTVAESQSRPARATKDNEETVARAFHSNVINGKIRAAVRGIRGQGNSGVLFPGDLDSNTCRPFMDVLRDKHPVMRAPDLSDPRCYSFEDYVEDLDVFPLDISDEDVIWVAGKLSGSSVPGGTYSKGSPKLDPPLWPVIGRNTGGDGTLDVLAG